MYRLSEEIMCQARIDIQQRYNLATSRVYELQGNIQGYTTQRYTDSINERIHCIVKPTSTTPTTSSGPRITNPCGLLWVPTKNRNGAPPCPRPDGGDLDYIDRPLCKTEPIQHGADFCSNYNYK